MHNGRRTSARLPSQEAAYHPEVSQEVQMRALRFGNECACGYLGLLEHVLVVRHTHTLYSAATEIGE